MSGRRISQRLTQRLLRLEVRRTCRFELLGCAVTRACSQATCAPANFSSERWAARDRSAATPMTDDAAVLVWHAAPGECADGVVREAPRRQPRRVPGTLLLVTAAELADADAYEVSAYKRIKVMLSPARGPGRPYGTKPTSKSVRRMSAIRGKPDVTQIYLDGRV
jgi:hypothetical protein